MNDTTNIKKEFVLDYKKWRCGNLRSEEKIDGFRITHGTKRTLMLSEAGYMYCLGQFSLQLGLNKEDILSKGGPSDLECHVEYLNTYGDDDWGENMCTTFSDIAISINDDPTINIPQRIVKLKKLCKENDFLLKVINLPKTIEDEVRRLENG